MSCHSRASIAQTVSLKHCPRVETALLPPGRVGGGPGLSCLTSGEGAKLQQAPVSWPHNPSQRYDCVRMTDSSAPTVTPPPPTCKPANTHKYHPSASCTSPRYLLYRCNSCLPQRPTIVAPSILESRKPVHARLPSRRAKPKLPSSHLRLLPATSTTPPYRSLFLSSTTLSVQSPSHRDERDPY